MPENPTFIDLCAGCGGLSLGLMEAGWNGRFAVEKNNLAFKTLEFNLLRDGKHCFHWPEWLPAKPFSLESLLSSHEEDLGKLHRKIDLLAGGPPCQGFSSLGRRLAHDPRNHVFKNYMKLVDLLQPKTVLIENVRGILHPFKSHGPADQDAERPPIYADIIKSALEALNYEVWSDVVHAKDYGVPQTRPRFILIGVRGDQHESLSNFNPFHILQNCRADFLRRKGLTMHPVTVREALSDLIATDQVEACKENPRFKLGFYGRQSSNYQHLLHGALNGAIADSHRFVNHRDDIVNKFRWFHTHCGKGKKIDQKERGEFATKKHHIYILDPNQPAPTVTTLPDDLLHYSDPRILTVREMARLQSFPDWFEFKGKYTTGGDKRTKECPRYTQVGNAVPPLLAEALGISLKKVLRHVNCKT